MDKKKLCSEEKSTLNVLLVGPPESSNMIDACKHILNLIVEKNTISKAEEVTMGKTVEFGGFTYETETSTYKFLRVPAHCNYQPNMISRAKQADIAVFFAPVDDNLDFRKVKKQVRECISFIMALSIKKVLLVTDWNQDSYELIRGTLSKTFTKLGFKDKIDFACLPVSFKTGKNVQSEIKEKPETGKNVQSETEEKSWWKGRCFFGALDAFKEPAHGDIIPRDMSDTITLALYIEKLVSVDLKLDENPNDHTQWSHRARWLLIGEKYTESFKAAAKAVEYGLPPDSTEKKDALYWIIQCCRNRAKKDFNEAIQSYKKASESIELNLKAVAASAASVASARSAMSLILKEIETESEKAKIESSIASHKVDVVKPEKLTKEKAKIESSIASHKVDVVKPEKLTKENMGLTKTKRERKKKITFSTTSDKQKEKEDSKKENVVSCVTGSEVKPNNKIIKISSITDYEIEIKEDGRTFFDGTKIMKNGTKLTQSFIECSTHQIQNYSALVSLGLSNANILTVGDIISIRGSESYFAVELVKPLDIFFSLEFETCCSQWSITGKLNSWTEEYKRTVYNEWWCFIKEKFKKIFRGVINALLYLHSKGSSCGNLFIFEHNPLYITPDEQVRILPSMDDHTTCNEDLIKFVKFMKNVINYPCLGHDLLLTALPNDISHLFMFLKDRKLNTVPLWWLLDHVIFWTPKECIDFIFQVKRVRNRPLYQTLNVITKNDGSSWMDRVPEEEPVLFGILKKGRDVASSGTDELEKQGYIQVHVYRKNSDIVRYMAAVYTHYNDIEYLNLREKELEMEEIEGKLRALFPKIYEQLMETLYTCCCSGLLTDEELMKLSRHYDK